MYSNHRDIDILNLICEFRERQRISPTFRDIQAEFDFSSPTIVVRAVKRLRKDGLVDNRPDLVRRSRVLVPTRKGKRYVSLLRAAAAHAGAAAVVQTFPRGNSGGITETATDDFKDIALAWLSVHADQAVPRALNDLNLVRFHRRIARDAKRDDEGYPLPAFDPSLAHESGDQLGLRPLPRLDGAPAPTVIGSQYQWVVPLNPGRRRQPDFFDFWYRAWMRIPEIEQDDPSAPPEWVLPSTLQWLTVAIFIREPDQPLHEAIMRTRQAAQYARGIQLGVASKHAEDREHLLRLDFAHVLLQL